MENECEEHDLNTQKEHDEDFEIFVMDTIDRPTLQHDQ